MEVKNLNIGGKTESEKIQRHLFFESVRVYL